MKCFPNAALHFSKFFMRYWLLFINIILYNFSIAQSIGEKVQLLAVDGQKYNGVVKEIKGDQYRIKYDGFDFEAWLTSDQFSVIAAMPGGYNPAPENDAFTNKQNQTAGTYLRNIFDFGKKHGWVTPVQEEQYRQYIAPLTEEEKTRLLNFIIKAKTASARFFVLKSWLVKDDLEILQRFMDELNRYPESYQQDKCLMTSRRSLIQQWQNTCAVTAVEALLADLCPRFAWDLKQIDHFDEVANDPNNPIAQQQKILLEKYGAQAVARGDVSAKVIPINGALDDFVTPILGVHFYTQEVNEPLPTVLSKIRSQLDKGLDVPLLVGFMGTGARHFVLAMKYRNTGFGNEYFMYDPWDGICDYVRESNILQNSFVPLLSSYKISIDYYYLTQ